MQALHAYTEPYIFFNFIQRKEQLQDFKRRSLEVPNLARVYKGRSKGKRISLGFYTNAAFKAR